MYQYSDLHHSANFLLPGAADYTAIAGDRIEVVAITTTQFRLSLLQTSVLNFATKSVFPTVGVDKALYLDKATGLLWRWDSTTGAYVGTPFPVDASDNLIANVNHRTGTLAYLLGIVGGEGEIAVPTDKPVFVKYGTGGVPEIIGGQLSICEAYQNGGTSIPNGVATIVPLSTVQQGAAYITLATGQIQPPDEVTAYNNITQEVTFVASVAADAGVLVQVFLEYNPIGIGWQTYAMQEVTSAPAGSTNVGLTVHNRTLGTGFRPKYRLKVYHNSAAAVTVYVLEFKVVNKPYKTQA